MTVKEVLELVRIGADVERTVLVAVLRATKSNSPEALDALKRLADLFEKMPKTSYSVDANGSVHGRLDVDAKA